jgi:hypothetical protein
VTVPDTPEDWRDALLAKLEDRQPAIDKLHRYYDGSHDLPPLPEKASNDIKNLRAHCVLNLCALVVDAAIERLAVQGFQFSEGDATDVWRDVWQPNRLDADSDLIHLEAMIARRAFALVWPNESGTVEITPESPVEMLVDYEPGSRRRRRAAIKRFTTGVGVNRRTTDVTLWLPGEVYRWTRPSSSGQWAVVDESTGPAPSQLGGEIPVVEFLSNPDLSGRPHSELDRGVLEVQDSINKQRFDLDVLSEFQAFPQRWAVGVNVETDSNNNAVAPFAVGPNKVVVNENENVKFGQWDAADMKGHLDAIESHIHGLAAQTKTPMYYLAAEFSNVSADAIRAAEAGLVKKVERHQRVFGESWEEVIRLALQARGDDRALDTSSMIEWADPETRTRAEEADAAVKLAPLLPRAETWRRLGYSPQDRQRFDADMMAESLIAGLAPEAEPVP